MSNTLIKKMKENNYKENMVYGEIFVSGIRTSGSHDTTLYRFQQHLSINKSVNMSKIRKVQPDGKSKDKIKIIID